MKRARRANKIAGTVAVANVVALAGLWALSPLAPAPASADGPISPHLSTGAVTDSCATCHRTHTAEDGNLLSSAAPQSALCFSCHDGTGANSNVAAQYSDASVPADDPGTSSFYSHPATTVSDHTSGQVDEFAGGLNRHSECSDCHNPHQANSAPPAQAGTGWSASGSLAGTLGVSNTLTWNPIVYEYELCLKCHSRYTTLLSYTKESYKKTDKAQEFDTANASYHPIEGAGKNSTTAMTNSLAGGKLWQFTTSSTIRCLNCHGNYRLVGDPPSPNVPTSSARLAPHTSRYRSLLIANYRDRDLKPASEAYSTNDFALCYLCHSETPFSSGSPSQTNFGRHKLHLTQLTGQGSGGLDIDTAGAGQGNAICAECHYRIHSTKLAPWLANQDYSRGINFAPDVQPVSGQTSPLWSLSNTNCTLVCHGKSHNPKNY